MTGPIKAAVNDTALRCRDCGRTWPGRPMRGWAFCDRCSGKTDDLAVYHNLELVKGERS